MEGSVGTRTLSRGTIVRYREWYGTQGHKLTNEQLGRGVAEREVDDPKLSDAVLDPSCFNTAGGPSIAEQINNVLLAKKLMPFREADNKRVPLATDRRGALSGWSEMRQRLVNGTICCFSTCRDSIRTIPVLQHDPMKAEDLDTKSEDHAADEWRYACMSRPWLRQKPIEEEFKFEDYRVNKDDPITDSFKTI
jgi:hypothetical protein